MTKIDLAVLDFKATEKSATETIARLRRFRPEFAREKVYATGERRLRASQIVRKFGEGDLPAKEIA